MSRHPSVKWAQRSDKLFITVELPDAQDVNLKLEPEGKFVFSATSGADKIQYELNLDLFEKVDVNDSKASVGLRNICYLVKKAEEKWWSRLIKQAGKPPVFLKVDWDKWVDEDEDEPEEKDGNDMDFGGIDFSKLSMGGGEDFDGGAEDEDEEEEEEEEEDDDESDSDSDTEDDNAEAAPPVAGETNQEASADSKPDAKA